MIKLRYKVRFANNIFFFEKVNTIDITMAKYRNIQDLPNEIIQKIFSYLSDENLPQLVRISKLFHENIVVMRRYRYYKTYITSSLIQDERSLATLRIACHDNNLRLAKYAKEKTDGDFQFWVGDIMEYIRIIAKHKNYRFMKWCIKKDIENSCSLDIKKIDQYISYKIGNVKYLCQKYPKITLNQLIDSCGSPLYKTFDDKKTLKLCKLIHNFQRKNKDFYTLFDDSGDISVGEIYCILIYHKYYGLIEWLIKKYRFTDIEINNWFIYMLHYKRAKLESLQWITEHYKIDIPRIKREISWRKIVRFNYFDIFRWMHQKFNITVEDIAVQYGPNNIFNSINAELDPEYQEADGDRGYMDICCNLLHSSYIFENIDFISYVNDNFGITKDYFIHDNNYLIRALCRRNQLSMLKRLYDEYRFTKEEFYNDGLPFRIICAHGNINILKWTLETFGPPGEETLENGLTDDAEYNSFLVDTKKNRYKCIIWCIQTINIKEESIYKIYKNLISNGLGFIEFKMLMVKLCPEMENGFANLDRHLKKKEQYSNINCEEHLAIYEKIVEQALKNPGYDERDPIPVDTSEDTKYICMLNEISEKQNKKLNFRQCHEYLQKNTNEIWEEEKYQRIIKEYRSQYDQK